MWIFYVSSSGTALDSGLVYNLITKQWGRADHSIEAAVNFVGQGVTWDTLGTFGSTWNTLQNIPWDSQLFQSGGRSLAVFNASHELKVLTGVSAGGSITTGDFGDDSTVSMLGSSKLRFSTSPTSATATGSYKMAEGDPFTPGGTSTLAGGKFDHRQSGRFHRVSYTMTGPFEVVAHQPDLTPVGQR